MKIGYLILMLIRGNKHLHKALIPFEGVFAVSHQIHLTHKLSSLCVWYTGSPKWLLLLKSCYTWRLVDTCGTCDIQNPWPKSIQISGITLSLVHISSSSRVSNHQTDSFNAGNLIFDRLFCSGLSSDKFACYIITLNQKLYTVQWDHRW
jgi:hypothetical protein